jgi:hypothetical protein
LTITTFVIEKEHVLFFCRRLRFAQERRSMTTPLNSNNNRILAALPEQEFDRLSAHLKVVELSIGQVLYEIEDRIEYVYFPVHSIVSLIQNTAIGQSVEVGLVGIEGMTGLPIIAGVTHSPYRAVVQGAGPAMRLKSPPPAI